jgi:hypothetical protein
MALTVVPIHNLNLPAGTVIPFGKFKILDVPKWLLEDPILQTLSEHDQKSVRTAKHALVSEYHADSYGHPDPEWPGTQPKGIQDLRWQSALLANMSIWMIMPLPVCISVGFHALMTFNGQQLERPIVYGPEHETTLFCHERDFHNPVTVAHLTKAATLFETLSAVSRKNSVWPALRAFLGSSRLLSGRYPVPAVLARTRISFRIGHGDLRRQQAASRPYFVFSCGKRSTEERTP